ncbi:signal recognition particle-docking protein FtsY [Methanococcus maripaludis]|uniref:Signal recognition particle receptor FtsY n=2 Tax=Methanococcus maripaludis TaxID=39152 RepID=A0A8T3W0Z0_METMI|nr:signal recognition particle-docking protein FtsY [Methanococcus maripaludis]MBG0769911.1 signal recognition particle-docking protein FtsY [Methanococcus maripaludis]MDK2929377.1 fused signal recognition particle receptor [Methanococcus sp.]BAP62815.1 cell division transporter substrate-binding protein [Methanococcus maripaludis OS7]
MFGSLKEKLNNTISKLSDKIYTKGEAKTVEEQNIKETPEKIIEENKTNLENSEKDLKEINTESFEKKEKIGFFDKLAVTKSIKKVLGKDVILTEDDIEDVLEEMEMELFEADVAFDVVEKIIESLKNQLVGLKISAKDDPEEITINALKKSIKGILSQEKIDVFNLIDEKKANGEPAVLLFVGINGTGKTTSISKLAYILKEKGYSAVMAAGDTFRAGAIEQLEEHGKNTGIKVIKHQKGADSAAVIYDAISHAKAKGLNVVLADTAGRQTTNINLMDEIKKVVRVTKPDLIIFVGDSLAGNDAISQAEEFNNAININGAILTKTDADAKGGAALSIAYSIGKPILFMGVGQRYSDLQEFDVDWMIKKLFSEESTKLSSERQF